MRIEVTKEDIDLGTRRNPCECPVARAIVRAAGERCSVGAYTVGFERWRWALLPDDARDFIAAFDFGCSVSPFSFDLSVEGAAS